jgi:membrane-associated phospholipid phosphatase
MEAALGKTLPRHSLPIVVTQETKYPGGIALFTIAAVIYLATNHFHLSEPRLLPLTWVDRDVPFLPYTMWVYISEFAFFGVVYVCCRDMINLNRFFYSFLALQVVSCLIFLIWPTTYPRDGFPLTDDLDPVTRYVFGALRQTDTPANCTPSLHVSSVYLCSFLFLDERPKLFPFFFTWGTLIAASTLTTKQHYLADVVTGLALSILIYWLFYRYFGYRWAGAQAKR